MKKSILMILLAMVLISCKSTRQMTIDEYEVYIQEIRLENDMLKRMLNDINKK